MNTILLIHLFACFAMTGIIWLVQVLIYPFFKIVGQAEFKILHDFQMKKISLIVAPLMLLELMTALWLLIDYSPPLTRPILYLNLISVLFLWGTTILKNIPSHHKLNFDSAKSKDILIFMNWPRTIVWTLRSLFLFYWGTQV
jgi:hypothetical protein